MPVFVDVFACMYACRCVDVYEWGCSGEFLKHGYVGVLDEG